ncbi:iron-sulfur cluster assembly accessory protein [Candidatus Woesearchaeota archaeon]|nr:iron-sulfur cluster assembly accessory protein [Candidatus Woesearchaeota archaeon]
MTDEQVDFVLSELNKVVADDEAPGENNKEFVVTKQAAAKLRELFMKEKKENYGLRISVVPGGCSGYSYGLEFENKETKEDKVLKENGVKIIIDNESLKMIKGSKLDFVDTLQGSGFKITNPNAVDSCGCGQSFR